MSRLYAAKTPLGTSKAAAKDDLRETVRGKSRETVRGKSRETVRGKSRETVRGKSRETVRGKLSGRVPGKSRDAAHDGEREFLRAENEDDDGYDPYSDRRARPEPLFERDPWS